MRFTSNGPSIPDELLNARDEGRVVFFCGSGVSRERAKLPDFFELAEDVIDRLGDEEDSDARKVLIKVREIGRDIDVPGLISVDRVFGLLERDFPASEIQAAVAKALIGNAEPDTSAHKILLRLATTSDAKIQLVTTNFDRLFEKCGRDVECVCPPRLPDVAKYDELDRIVYLHGRVNDEYTGADGNEFVLSSSDFGHAYLSEGWAAEFFREIVHRYVVLFVGYSADDPPINYLLEGLRRNKGLSRLLYAFQAQESGETADRWSHKGVEAIPYDPLDSHRSLWDSLELWAKRSDDPTAWRQSTIAKAMNGPQRLQAYERGQVAHIVSACDGAREFAEAVPPAEWLCVFDPSCRYARPQRRHWFKTEEPVIDPFDLYGLDSDKVPERGSDDSPFLTDKAPADAWDAFTANNYDLRTISNLNTPAIRGHDTAHLLKLPSRLSHLGSWIASVASQPASVWWASMQDPLHPSVRREILWRLRLSQEDVCPEIEKAWRYLVAAWDQSEERTERDWYDLNATIDRDGWSPYAARRFVTVTRPYINASPASMSGPIPPPNDAEVRLRDLGRFRVECPVPLLDIEIPIEYLGDVISGFRTNIELSVHLCNELDDPELFRISPIVPDENAQVSSHTRKNGLSGYILWFASTFEQLCQCDKTKARQEYSVWPKGSNTIFSRLKVWASGNLDFASPHMFYTAVMEMSDEEFWDWSHQRDLLLSLATRWTQLSDKSRSRIETRLLQGPKQRDSEDDTVFTQRKARLTLNRLQWLAGQGCIFAFDVHAEIEILRVAAPTWKPEHARRAVDSTETQFSPVAIITEHELLLQEPISSILSVAENLTGRSEQNTFENHEPFKGLCDSRPRRAYLALLHAARHGEFPIWAWKAFYSSFEAVGTTPDSETDARRQQLIAPVAERLCRISDEVLSSLLYPSSCWLREVTKPLSSGYPQSFDKLTSKLIGVIHQYPEEDESSHLTTGRSRDWVTDGLKSSSGQITMAIFDNSWLERDDIDTSPSATWLIQLERLLAVGNNPRRQAIATMTHHLGWFYHHVPEWTSHNLLSILDAEDQHDQEAFWAGFLWNPRVNTVGLYSRLKPGLLSIAKCGGASQEGRIQALASEILSGWISRDQSDGERLVSNDEFRHVLLHAGDEFRSHVIGQFQGALNDDPVNDGTVWLDDAVELFDNVWPRQIAVKTPTMTNRLCGLLISNVEAFPRLVDVVLPLLSKVPSSVHFRLHFGGEADAIIQQYPGPILTVLYTVMSDEIRNWHNRIDGVLEKIGVADSRLVQDSRYQELLKRWNSR
ncbi:hypothetical protein Mal52_27930 [Symmachiella dynata]|uniref:Uncharacterized protein n=2 Tax=Symmachiella dynata TaxID=2527995 RepID=A0A517ZPA5_9PLAN|nr:hypothetical protein Mal52_27930 [Symmachiella dynata]